MVHVLLNQFLKPTFDSGGFLHNSHSDALDSVLTIDPLENFCLLLTDFRIQRRKWSDENVLSKCPEIEFLLLDLVRDPIFIM